MFAYHCLLTALAYQCEDLEGTPYEQNTKYFLKRTVDNGLGDQDAADIIFVMDESGLIYIHTLCELYFSVVLYLGFSQIGSHPQKFTPVKI